MQVVRQDIDKLNACLKVTVEKADYQEKVEKALKDYRKKAQVPGFRPGMVPAGIIKKMYGKGALVEEVYRMVSESLYQYINDNKIDILGEPLPSIPQPNIDFDNETDFAFSYDLALAPQIDLTLGKTIKVPSYSIKVDQKEKEARIERYLSYYGDMVDTETAGAEDMLKVTLTQPDGLTVENAVISLKVLSEEHKKDFVGGRLGDMVSLNVNETFSHEGDRAALLKVKKEELASIQPEFTATITDIKTFQAGEINQAFFDKVYGPGTVNSVEAFEAKIEAEIAGQLAEESEFKLMLDIRDALLKKVQIDLPEAFLKRWLLTANEGKVTEEQIEKDFDQFAQDLKWQLIKGSISKEGNVEVTEEDALAYAKKMAAYQFAQYGLMNLPDDQLIPYAQQLVQDQEQSKKIVEKVLENKIIEYVKEKISLTEKKISVEDFGKLFEEK